MKTPKLLLIILLALACLPMPIGYYTFLRISVCGLAVYLGVKAGGGWRWVWLAMAVLFNPVLPVYLGRERWLAADVAALVVALVSAGARGRR